MVARGVILSSHNPMRSLNNANYSSCFTAHSFHNTAIRSHSVAYLSTSSGPAHLPWVYFDCYLCTEVQTCTSSLLILLQMKGGWKKKSRERMIGEFFPIPKKEKHRHIFAIVQNRGEKPIRLRWIVFVKDRTVRCTCDGT